MIPAFPWKENCLHDTAGHCGGVTGKPRPYSVPGHEVHAKDGCVHEPSVSFDGGCGARKGSEGL